MKKRVLSALLALCLTLSLAGAAFAENETLSPVQETSVSESASSAAEPASEEASEPEQKAEEDITESSSGASSESQPASESADSTSGEEKDTTESDSDVASNDTTTSDSTSASGAVSDEEEKVPAASTGDENAEISGQLTDEELIGEENSEIMDENSIDGDATTVENGIDTFASVDDKGISQCRVSWNPNAVGATHEWVTVIFYNQTSQQEIKISGEDITEWVTSHTDMENGATWDIAHDLPEIEGYTFNGAEYWRENAPNNVKSISQIRASREKEWSWGSQKWYYYVNDGDAELIRENRIFIRLNYVPTTVTPDPDPGVDSDYKIEDTVRSNGYFTVLQSDGDVLPEGYTVQWYRAFPQDESNQYPQDGWSEEISRVRVHKDMYNLSADKESLNVTLDAKLAGVQDAQRLWYKAVVLDENGQAVSTLYKRVPYYIELQNGGF